MKDHLQVIVHLNIYRINETISSLLQELVKPHEAYRIENALTLVGIIAQKDQLFGTLSSGQKTRVYLARLILNDPEILLLDEPTNHLDIEALEWLENYLKTYKGSVVVISHDRAFLDRVVQTIFELDQGKIKIYGGNYSEYKKQKLIEKEAYERAYEGQQKTIKQLQKTAKDVKEKAKKNHDSTKPTRDNDKFVAHFFAERSSKKLSSRAKNMEHRLETMERMEKPKKEFKMRALFSLKHPTPSVVVKCENLTCIRNKNKILNNITFSIQKTDRVALLGSNGGGKSTLVKLIIGELKPTDGNLSLGPSVSLGYLSQDHNELSSKHSVSQELMIKCGIDETTAYRLLKRFVLPEKIMSQAVKTLSSGEQSKLLLAEVMASGANFIILDEPTNHLDIPTREALESALREYEGALLVISHDRYFLENIGINRRITLANGNLHIK